MARFFGKIGFVKTEETKPGIWEEVAKEREYYGDVIRHSRRWDTPTQANDNLTLSNEISILADEYVLNNLEFLRYVKFMDGFWCVNYIEVNRPRIRLTLGGRYNGITQG